MDGGNELGHKARAHLLPWEEAWCVFSVESGPPRAVPPPATSGRVEKAGPLFLRLESGRGRKMAGYQLTCIGCGRPFTAQRRDAKTCSRRCRNRIAAHGYHPLEGAADSREASECAASDPLAFLPPPAIPDSASKGRTYLDHQNVVQERGWRGSCLMSSAGSSKAAFYQTTNWRACQDRQSRSWPMWRRRDDGWYSAGGGQNARHRPVWTSTASLTRPRSPHHAG